MRASVVSHDLSTWLFVKPWLFVVLGGPEIRYSTRQTHWPSNNYCLFFILSFQSLENFRYPRYPKPTPPTAVRPKVNLSKPGTEGRFRSQNVVSIGRGFTSCFNKEETKKETSSFGKIFQKPHQSRTVCQYFDRKYTPRGHICFFRQLNGFAMKRNLNWHVQNFSFTKWLSDYFLFSIFYLFDCCFPQEYSATATIIIMDGNRAVFWRKPLTSSK